jgi:hypothetical protein
MNKLSLYQTAFVFCIISFVFSLPSLGDDSFPLLITPGYGTSNYFELMPGKVAISNVMRPKLSFISTTTMTARITGNVLHVELHGGGKEFPLEVSLFDLSGKRILIFNTSSNKYPRNTYAFPFKSLPKGVYLINVRFSETSLQTKGINF